MMRRSMKLRKESGFWRQLKRGGKMSEPATWFPMKRFAIF